MASLRYNPLIALGLDLVETGGGGGGTVTSVAGGFGITNTPEPIVGAGAVDLDLFSLTTETTLAAGDWFPFVDVSVGTAPADQRKVTLANLAAFVQSSLGLVDGSGASPRVAFWADANTLTSDADFVYDSATNVLTVPVVQGPTTGGLKLRKNSDTSIVEGIELLDNVTQVTTDGSIFDLHVLRFTPTLTIDDGCGLIGYEFGNLPEHGTVWSLTPGATSATPVMLATLAPQVSNATGETQTLGLLGSIYQSYTVQENGGAFTVSNAAFLTDSNVYTGVAVTEAVGLDVVSTFDAGSVAATVRGVRVRPGVFGGSSITTFVGVDVEAPTATTSISLRSSATGAQLRHAGSAIFGANEAPVATLSVGSGSLFRVAGADGDLERIKNVAYDWPAANAAGQLTNDSSGNLSWSSAAVAGFITVQESDSTIDSAVTTLDFTETDGTLVTSSPAGEANINMDLYFLRSGRPTGRNSYVLSSDSSTALLSGGTAGGQNVDFESTTSGTKGVIQFRDPMRWFSNPPANLTATTNVILSDNNLTYASGSAQTLRYINILGTHTLADNVSSFQGMRVVPTLTSGASTAFTLGTHTGFNMGTTFTPGASASMTDLVFRGLVSGPTLSNAGTGNTATTVVAANSGGAINTNWTVTDWYGVLMSDPGGTGGTITNLYGIHVAALTSRSSTLVAAYSSAVAAGTGKYFLYDTGGAQSFMAGKFTTYNNIATEGGGVPAIRKEAITGTVSANTTIVTLTPPATAGRYRISAVVTSTSGTNTGTVAIQTDYTNSQGTAITNSVIPLLSDNATAFAATGTGASRQHRSANVDIAINNAAANIVVKLVVTGTVNVTAAACIEQLT